MFCPAVFLSEINTVTYGKAAMGEGTLPRQGLSNSSSHQLFELFFFFFFHLMAGETEAYPFKTLFKATFTCGYRHYNLMTSDLSPSIRRKP